MLIALLRNSGPISVVDPASVVDPGNGGCPTFTGSRILHNMRGNPPFRGCARDGNVPGRSVGPDGALSSAGAAGWAARPGPPRPRPARRPPGTPRRRPRRGGVAPPSPRTQRCRRGTVALDADGRILGLRDIFVHDTGAYSPYGIIVPLITACQLPGPYKLPAYYSDATVVYTNRTPVSPYRGAGRPHGVFAMERILDHAADQLGMDRAEISPPQHDPTRRVSL